MDKEGRRSSCDPGWNDPPLFTYESQSKASKPRTFLNKRVAFPLNEASPPSNFAHVDPTAPLSTSNLSTLPPPPSMQFTPPEVTAVKSGNDSNPAFDPSQVLETVMINFNSVLNMKFEDEGKDKTEIQRRLETMKKLWTDDKLCDDIQHKLLQLSEALKKDEMEKVDDLQKCLMVDHATACSSWMSGIRHLMHHQPRQQLDME